MYYTLLHTSQRSVFDLVPEEDWYESFFFLTYLLPILSFPVEPLPHYSFQLRDSRDHVLGPCHTYVFGHVMRTRAGM
jgi:hypothetical protein